MIEPDPEVSGDVTLQILYGIYYRQLKQDVLGTLTKTYIFHFVGGLDCDRVSELSYAIPVLPVGVETQTKVFTTVECRVQLYSKIYI